MNISGTKRDITKRKMPIYSTLKSLLNKCIFEMTYFSGHVHFKILDHASTYSQLKIKENFLIEQLKPELNKHVEHVSLPLHF